MITSVPNVSEGRDPLVIAELAAAAGEHCHVLHLDPGPDANRTVFTLAGGDLPAALFAMAEVAVRAVDLRTQRGVHVRMGAIDVIPFVPNPVATDDPRPWDPAEMAACGALARGLGERLAAELALPGWAYGHGVRELRAVRREGFEVLPATMAELPCEYRPLGVPLAPHPSAGAFATGARPQLVAFNVCLATKDVAVARRVAKAVRGSAGGLPGVMAIGWYTPGFGCAQVSMNLTRWWETPPHLVLERIRALAPVLGSELVGMMPLGALTAAAEFYGTDLDGAADRLGLRYCKPFSLDVHVLDFALRRLR